MAVAIVDAPMKVSGAGAKEIHCCMERAADNNAADVTEVAPRALAMMDSVVAFVAAAQAAAAAAAAAAAPPPVAPLAAQRSLFRVPTSESWPLRLPPLRDLCLCIDDSQMVA